MISNAQYVCTPCRQLTAFRRCQFREASFVSLGGLIHSNHGNGSDIGRQQTTGASSSISENKAPNKTRLLPQASRQQKPSRVTGVDKILEGLFVSNQQSSETSRLRYSHTPIPKSTRSPASTTPKENDFEILKRMQYTEQASLENLWLQYQKTVKSKEWELTLAKDPQEIDAPSKDDVFKDLLLAICRSRSQEPFRSSLPTPATVIKSYLQHRHMRYWWDKVLWIEIGVLVNWNYHFINAAQNTDVPAIENAVRLFEDILDVWQIFVDQHGHHKTTTLIQTPSDSSCDHYPGRSSTSSLHANSKPIIWRGLPADTELILQNPNFPVAVSDRFIHYLPKHRNNRQVGSIAGAAILTYDCFQNIAKHVTFSQSISETAIPFLRFLEHIIRGGKLDRQTSTKCLLGQGISLKIIDDALTGWGPKPAIEEEKPRSTESPLDKSICQGSLTWTQSQLTSIQKDLTRATERSDIGQAINHWRNFVSRFRSNDLGDEMIQPIFLKFLSTFFTLRRPEQSVAVWNHMMSLGHKPNQKHWHAMILGCAKAKDLVSMQGIWANMKEAGFQPDIQSWTTWIHGLIRCGSWQLGLEALEELGVLWKNGSANQINGSEHERLSPSIIPVNAAIAALQATGKANIVPHILKWARSQNLPLDTSTFNTMLRHLINKDDNSPIKALLASMEKHNCAPDIATFTTVLNGLVSNPGSAFHRQTFAEQMTTILSILDDMQQKGLRANAHTYTTILDGLLPPQNPNLLGARAVLDHMAQRHIKPSPHIYTILSGHYFSASPPNLAALDALWLRIRADGRSVLDPVFYDRMIEGYARVGEVEKMLAFVKRAPAEGKSPSWVALAAVMRALHAAREWDLIKDLVADVLDPVNGLLRHGEGGRTGKERYWEMVDELIEDGVVEISGKEWEVVRENV